MAIRQSPEDYFGQTQRVHEEPLPVYSNETFYEPAHTMFSTLTSPSSDMKWGLLILALVAIVGLIGLFAVLGTKDRK